MTDRPVIPGEIEFSDDEVAELGIEVLDPARKKKRGLRVPLDEVPRAPSLTPSAIPSADRRITKPTVRQPPFSPTDLIVEAAFAKTNGAAAKPGQTADSPWDGEEEELEIEDSSDFPTAKTTISPPPTPSAEAATESGRHDITDPQLDPPPRPPQPALSDPAPLPAPPLAAAGPAPSSVPPPPPPDDDVLSSSPAPNTAGPKVAVRPEVSGKVSLGGADSGAVTAPVRTAVSEPVELHGDEMVEVRTPPPTPLPLPLPPPPAQSAVPPLPATRTERPTAPIPVMQMAQTAPAAAPPPMPSAPPAIPAGASLPPPPPSAAAPPPPPSAAAPPPPPSVAAAPPPPPLPVAATAPPPPVPAGAAADDKPRRKRRAKQWFEEIFDEDYLRTLPFMTPRQTERESSFILEALGIQNQAAMLDLGCGYGRHAMELAGRGHKVTGLDLSLPLLIRAADAARRVGVNVNFVHGDMRELAFDGEFDAAYCYFTTFGYFDDDTNRKVAASLAKALKPGGRLLLDVVNRDFLIGDLPTRVWWQGEGCVVLEEVDFNYFTSRLQVQRSIVFEDGRQSEQDISIRAYSLHEIGKVLHHAGFRVIEASGSPALRGKFFGTAARQILVVAEKRKDP